MYVHTYTTFSPEYVGPYIFMLKIVIFIIVVHITRIQFLSSFIQEYKMSGYMPYNLYDLFFTCASGYSLNGFFPFSTTNGIKGK